MNNDDFDLTAILEASYARHLNWVQAADNKATVLLGMAVGMLGWLYARLPDNCPVAVTIVGIGLGGAVLVKVLWHCASCIIPRTEPPIGKDGTPQLSNLFFGTIASRTRAEFAASLSELDRNCYQDDLIRQVHVNARIVNTKFDEVKTAFVWMAIGIFPWSGALVLFEHFRLAGDVTK